MVKVNMNYVYTKSSIGFSHKALNKSCEDYSLTYKDKYRTIIALSDGHGGDVYVRSERGSYFAGIALLNVFINMTNKMALNLDNEDLKNKLKLSVLCEWNKLVEQDLKANPIRRREIEHLKEEDIDSLKLNPTRAYGATLVGALLINNHLVVISIGDSESFIVKKGIVSRVFNDLDEPVGNITYSLCQEDAYKYLNVKLLDFNEIDALILGTDGLTSPYQSYDNFQNSFVKPLINKVVLDKDMEYISNFIDDLASKLGTGDDVSLGYIISSKRVYKKYYSEKK